MTVSEPDPDVLFTDSGGRMVRLRDLRPPSGPPDLPLLEEHRTVDLPGPLRTWRGPGILRVAPAGKPWSIWYFWDDDGGFEGHYVNLELVHQRPVSGEPRVHTRDLTLDLWLEAADVWLKDEDELEAAVEGGRLRAGRGGPGDR